MGPQIKTTYGVTASFIEPGEIKKRMVAAEISVNSAGPSKAHKKIRQFSFADGNGGGGSAFGVRYFAQNGHHIAE